MNRSFVLPLTIGALLAGMTAAAGPGVKTQLIGGTPPSIAAKSTARLDFTGADQMVFRCATGEIRVPYRKVNTLEYGQTVSRRYAAAVLVSPMLLLSKERKHFVTLGYVDAEGKQQALVFRVGKGDIRSRAGRPGSAHRPAHGVPGRRSPQGRQRMTCFRSLCWRWRWRAERRIRRRRPAPIEETGLRQLLTIRRVFVDRLTGGETAAQMRDILISSMAGSELFVLTENPERADVTMRGAAEDLVFTDEHTPPTASTRTPTLAPAGRRPAPAAASAGLGVGENESDHSTERRHEAIAAVRLVNKDGDVIWSTTEESLGAKFHGASADVADKITAKLKEDFERARKLK